jgi:hypothetical protein
MKKFVSPFFALALIFALYSCASKQQEEGSASTDFDAAQEDPGGVSDNLEGIIYNIPPPSEIPYLLEATGVEFNGSLVNSYNIVDKYKTTFDVAALNLGIYAADLGYLSSNDKTQDAINYLTSMKSLADHLGVSSAYNEDIMVRFESNIGSRDSLQSIINEGVENADELLKSEDRSQTAALMTTGSFVEGLHIATQLIATYPDNVLTPEQRMTVLTPLITVVLEQENSLGDLIKLASSVPQDGLIATVTEDLKTLQQIYSELDIAEKINNNQTEDLLGDETLGRLSAQVSKLRTEIVE